MAASTLRTREDDVSQNKPRAAIVVNPTKVDVERLRAAVAAATPEGWPETLWFETTEHDAGQEVTRRAIAEEVTLVIAAGGDGTIRAVAETVAGTGVALAVVASGSGNLLARNLDLHLNDPIPALDVAFQGEARPVDVGRVETEVSDGSRQTYGYMVMAGIGLDADMASGTNETVKRVAGWLAYAAPIAKSAISRKNVRVRYRMDDERPRRASAHTIIVGNCGTLTANLLLLPAAVIDDGLLDVVLLRPLHFWGWFRVGVRLLFNRTLHKTRAGRTIVNYGRRVPGLEYSQGRTFAVRFEEPELLELDGDEIGKVMAFRTWIDHRALSVMVPREG